ARAGTAPRARPSRLPAVSAPAGASLRRRQARVPDVAVELPLAVLPLPDDHVLALIDRLPAFAGERVPADLVGQVALRLRLERRHRDALDPAVDHRLPEAGDRLPASDHLAVRRERLG